MRWSYIIFIRLPFLPVDLFCAQTFLFFWFMVTIIHGCNLGEINPDLRFENQQKGACV